VLRRLRQVLYALTVLLASVLAIANRTIVTVSLDPFSPASGEFSFRAPLFLVIFLSILLGILLGGLAVKFGQRKPVSPPVAAIGDNTGAPARF